MTDLDDVFEMEFPTPPKDYFSASESTVVSTAVHDEAETLDRLRKPHRRDLEIRIPLEA
ncbi:MAG: hypothetical protein NVV57_09500 [Demequina sp.]|nr:hypothetical protein [Demequina sp.]